MKVRNCATLTFSSPPDVNGANNQSCAPVDLSVLTKTVDQSVVHEGDLITYTIKVKNNGPSYATGIVVSSPESGNVIISGFASSQGTFDPSTSMWSVGGLAVGEEATLYITAVVRSGIAPSTIVDCATLSALGADRRQRHEQPRLHLHRGRFDGGLTPGPRGLEERRQRRGCGRPTRSRTPYG